MRYSLPILFNLKEKLYKREFVLCIICIYTRVYVLYIYRYVYVPTYILLLYEICLPHVRSRSPCPPHSRRRHIPPVPILSAHARTPAAPAAAAAAREYFTSDR